MSELTITKTGGTFFREHLLISVCAAALAISAVGAHAEDANRPVVWIELGTQLERMNGSTETFQPPFMDSFAAANLDPVLPLQRPTRYSYGGEGKISFAPRGSDWILSAGVRYGRSNGAKASNQQLPAFSYTFVSALGAHAVRFQTPPIHLDAAAATTESHAIVDFQAGKDVGLGLFSPRQESTLSVGVRFAQFVTRQTATMNGVPDFYQHGNSIKNGGVFNSHHFYSAAIDADHGFRGVGPSLSWDASAPLVSHDESRIAFDWGINAAMLFGRQKVSGSHSTKGIHYKNKQQKYAPGSYHRQYPYNSSANLDRSRSVIVPNLGGFAGISFRYSNARVRFGYRADIFFGATDTGIDTRDTANRNFYGPFATISIGLP